MRKTVMLSALVALIISVSTLGIGYYLIEKQPVQIEYISEKSSNNLFTKNDKGEIVPLDFTAISEQVVDAVVHIQSIQNMDYPKNAQGQQRQLPDPFRDFFGEDLFRPFFFGPEYDQRQQQPRQEKPRRRMGSGSGVIINENGYIVTNNHVIANADELEVSLHDNRTYKAMVVGTDPSTDLALIQIKERNLPTLPLINSDEVKVGEWVLAVGNPFSLNSTVTAGIVSAKARNINILREKFAVESFIQTDAAINPGNSGGALVNMDGGLIGINTAIQSPTGSYSGYGFAIPSNIVNKVIEDFLNYGSVQRGVLGVMIRSIDGRLAEEKDLDLIQGVYVDSLFENSAAADAGIRKGDIITEVNGITVESSPELQEVIARYRPGDPVTLRVNRQGKNQEYKVILRNLNGKTSIDKKEHAAILNMLGVEMENLDDQAKKELDIDHGIKITKIYAGKIKRETQMREGFVITHMDDQKVKDVEDFIKKCEKKNGGVMVEGIYEDIPGKYYYAFGINGNT